MLTRKGESSGDLNPEQPGNQGVVRAGERPFLRKEPPIGYPIPSAQLPHHMLTGNIVQAEKVLFMCLGMYICIYVTTIQEREQKGCMGGVGRRKKKGNDGCNYILIFKKLKSHYIKKKERRDTGSRREVVKLFEYWKRAEGV